MMLESGLQCGGLAQLVNYAPEAREVNVEIKGMSSRLAVNITTLTSTSFWDTNNFTHSEQVPYPPQPHPCHPHAFLRRSDNHQ